MERLQHTVQCASNNLKIKENLSGRSYRAVSCQASNSLYIIQGFKEFSNTAYY